MRIDGREAAPGSYASRPAAPQNREGAESKEYRAGGNELYTAQAYEQDKYRAPAADKEIYGAVERANKSIMVSNRRFEYSIHEKTKEIMVKVIDTDTNEVIREIPPDKILDMVSRMWELAGLIIDEKR